MIYRRHDPPPPHQPAKPRRQHQSSADTPPSNKTEPYTREIIRKKVDFLITTFRRDDQPQRPDAEVKIILDWLEQSGTLDQWNCSAACQRLAESLLTPLAGRMEENPANPPLLPLA
jgi:hypothetical protein